MPKPKATSVIAADLSFASHGVEVTARVVAGSPAAMLVGEATRRRASIVVVGASESSRVRPPLLGGVAQAVSWTTSAPVLVVRERSES